MIRMATAASLPKSLRLSKISFIGLWNYDALNLTASYENGKQSFSFGYLYDNGETEKTSRACWVIEERDTFQIETRSMIWRIAEIQIERQNEWLIFSRQQDDLSLDALSGFTTDSKNYLQHLRDEHKRLNSE